jgi:hypothetical protein
MRANRPSRNANKVGNLTFRVAKAMDHHHSNTLILGQLIECGW